MDFTAPLGWEIREEEGESKDWFELGDGRDSPFYLSFS